MRLGIFAAVKIKKGEEITYDYAFQYDYAEYVGGGAHPCLGPFVSDQPFCAPFFAFLPDRRDNNKKGKRRECHCGAAECVGKI
jgi:SET domain-containing protein